jgi:hypothetical protein
LEIAQGPVALVAEQHSISSGGVVMIHREAVKNSLAHFGFRLITNTASMLLRREHFFIVRLSQTISNFSPISTNTLRAGRTDVRAEAIGFSGLVITQFATRLPKVAFLYVESRQGKTAAAACASLFPRA